MYQLLLGLYILVCFLLVVFILMQQGRGGGLVESFSAAETLFGGKTNLYMVRITIVLGVLFLSGALLLNYVVVQRSKSVMRRFFSRSKTVSTPNNLEDKVQSKDSNVASNKPEKANINTDSMKQQKEKQIAAGKSQTKQNSTKKSKESAPVSTTVSTGAISNSKTSS